jgi:hypothetical protein
MKSSSTCLITASLCEGPFFYFYVESSSSNFKTLLESIAIILSAMCLSQNTVNYGITLMLVSLIFFTSSLLLNFRGASAFMFCSINKGKQDTTLSYHLCILQSCSFLCSCYLLLVCWLSFIVCLTMR